MKFLTTILFVCIAYIVLGQRTSQKIDYKKIYQSWIPISEHTDADTIVNNYIKDTTKYTWKLSYPSWVTFDTSGTYYNQDDDFIQVGKFKLDSLRGTMEGFCLHQQLGDKNFINRIVFLNNKYLLLWNERMGKVFVDFYMSRLVFYISKRDNSENVIK